MAFACSKTEHNGPKRGQGFWGRKAEAEHQSSRTRRRNSRQEIAQALHQHTPHPASNR